MLVATNLYKSYTTEAVLKGINMYVSTGEIVALTGDSGAGKSTLLHILATLDQADSGLLTIDGQDTVQLQGKKLAIFRNQKIGVVFQEHHLLPEFTALENICLPGYLGTKSQQKIHKRAMFLLDIFGLTHRAQHKPTMLSGGEQQRIAVARALINEPKIVFADEPSGRLDTKNAEILYQLICKLRNTLQQTFVIVTHNATLAKIADRILIMKDGHLLV